MIKKRLGKLHRGILFHCDIAPAHSSRAARAVLREFCREILPHPPYSLALAPSNCFLFSKLKKHLKGTRFLTIDDAKNTTLIWFQSKPPEFFKRGLERWKHFHKKCIDLDEGYVEK